MNIDLFGNIIGYTGMILVVFAFFMIQRSKPNMITYNIINLIASALLLISLCIHTNIASMTLEVFWIGGSIYGIISNIKRNKQKPKTSNHD